MLTDSTGHLVPKCLLKTCPMKWVGDFWKWELTQIMELFEMIWGLEV